MDEYEVRYHRNRSLFKSGSAPQLTVMGSHKQHPELKHEVVGEGSGRVVGLLGQNKLSQNHFVKSLMQDRRARVAKHNAQDIKTFFTAEERARIFTGKRPLLESGEHEDQQAQLGELRRASQLEAIKEEDVASPDVTKDQDVGPTSGAHMTMTGPEAAFGSTVGAGTGIRSSGGPSHGPAGTEAIKPAASDYLQRATAARPSSPVGPAGKIALQTSFQRREATKMPFIGQDDRLEKEGLTGSPGKHASRFAGGAEVNLDEQALAADDPELAAKSYKPKMATLTRDPGAEEEQEVKQEAEQAAEPVPAALRGPPQQVEGQREHYVDKLVDEVNNAKLGSPLRVPYAASPVLMYAQMRPARDVDIAEVLERAEEGAAAEQEKQRLRERKRTKGKGKKKKRLKEGE
jgi:hypothetical protein